MNAVDVAVVVGYAIVAVVVTWQALARRRRRPDRETIAVGVKRVAPLHCDTCLKPIHDGGIMVRAGASLHHGECVTLVREGGVIVSARLPENDERTAAEEFRASVEYVRAAEDAP